MAKWFESWFNTKFYHILYRDRNEAEAKEFIRNLIHHLGISRSDEILDLACGTGRHARFLDELGYSVTGVDLSPENIKIAQSKTEGTAKFFVHDMREPIKGESFDFILNLFTSFGYFDSADENLKTLKAAHQNLRPNGKILIDFFNVARISDGVLGATTKEVEGITFHIEKAIREDKICKHISFEAEGKSYDFEERVQLIDLNDFERMLKTSGFRLLELFGNYQFESYDEASNRLILIAKKTK